MELPGQERFAERVAAYCLTDAWFNDYHYAYPYLLYYAGAPHEAQRIIRTSWVPLFEKGVMYEGVRPRPPHNGWQDHYSSVAGWLLGSMVGLYPTPTPPGQFIISSPSVTKAVLRNGAKRITVETKKHTAENIYVHRIELDGKDYPAYMIPARRLAAGASLVLTTGNDATHALGDLYIASSDGFVAEAELASATRLRGVIEAAVMEARTKVFSRARPIAVRVNGLPASDWDYEETSKTLSLRTSGRARLWTLACALFGWSVGVEQAALAATLPHDAQVYFIPFSHLDFYWGGTREECLARGNQIIAKAVRLANESPKFRFLLEDNVFVANYVDSHPGSKEVEYLKRFVKEGRIEIAPKWAGIFQALPDGEVHARNMAIGKRYAQDVFGVDAPVAHLGDLPGYTPQLPQILQQSRVPYAVMTRMGPADKSLFRWQAPDGSKVLLWNSLKGYGWGTFLTSCKFAELRANSRSQILKYNILANHAGTGGPDQD
jgi:hypothetical protein